MLVQDSERVSFGLVDYTDSGLTGANRALANVLRNGRERLTQAAPDRAVRLLLPHWYLHRLRQPLGYLSNRRRSGTRFS